MSFPKLGFHNLDSVLWGTLFVLPTRLPQPLLQRQKRPCCKGHGDICTVSDHAVCFISKLWFSCQALTEVGWISTKGSDSCCWLLWQSIDSPLVFVLPTSSLFPTLSPVLLYILFYYLLNSIKGQTIHSGTNDHIATYFMFVLSGKKTKFVYSGAALREPNWRWVLVSGLGQKNVHGPKDSWDITPTPWG